MPNSSPLICLITHGANHRNAAPRGPAVSCSFPMQVLPASPRPSAAWAGNRAYRHLPFKPFAGCACWGLQTSIKRPAYLQHASRNAKSQTQPHQVVVYDMASEKTEDGVEPSVETKSMVDQTNQNATAMYSGIDPELVAAISSISPQRRAEIEKRVKLKIDLFLFPLLLIFYILNYLVRVCPFWKNRGTNYSGPQCSRFCKACWHRKGPWSPRN